VQQPPDHVDLLVESQQHLIAGISQTTRDFNPGFKFGVRTQGDADVMCVDLGFMTTVAFGSSMVLKQQRGEVDSLIRKFPRAENSS